MITHPSVAGAAVLAGLLVAGGSYAARHDVGLGSALPASADARAQLERELSAGYARAPAPAASPGLARAPRPQDPCAPPAAPVAVVTAARPRRRWRAGRHRRVPVATSAPVTRTSPVGGGDDGGGDD